MQCFGSVLVRLTEPLGSAEPPNLTEPLSSAEPEPVPERFGLPLDNLAMLFSRKLLSVMDRELNTDRMDNSDNIYNSLYFNI